LLKTFQGGSWQNQLPQVLKSQLRKGSVSVRSHPRNWGGQQLLEDVVMTSKVTMLDKVVKVSCDQEEQAPGASASSSLHLLGALL
jgi:hypothetical protein